MDFFLKKCEHGFGFGAVHLLRDVVRGEKGLSFLTIYSSRSFLFCLKRYGEGVEKLFVGVTQN